MMVCKKIIAIATVLIMCAVPVICCAPSSSSVQYDDLSAEAVFSRATVTYLEDVRYCDHMDRTDCWFFEKGSQNEKIFKEYVTRVSDKVPVSDDREKLGQNPSGLCNVYNLGLNPKFTVNDPLLTVDYIHVNVKSGQRLTVNMSCGVGKYYHIMQTGSSEVMTWYYDRAYITTADKDTEYKIFPYNEGMGGGTINIGELFTKVTYDVSVSSGTASNGNNVVLAVVLFIIGAAVIATIVLCSRKIPWAKNAAEPGEIPDEENDSSEENGQK